MSNDAHIEALRAAGHHDAADLLARLTPAAGPSPQQPPIGQPLEAHGTPAATAADPQVQQFLDQIQAAANRGGGWTSTPIDAPVIPDGRF